MSTVILILLDTYITSKTKPVEIFVIYDSPTIFPA